MTDINKNKNFPFIKVENLNFSYESESGEKIPAIKNVSFEIEYLSDEKEERESQLNRLRTEMLAGDGPDIFLLSGRVPIQKNEPLFVDVEQTMYNGMFHDLSAYYNADTELKTEEFNETIMAAGTIGEARYILPFYYDLPVIQVNEAALGEYGLTIEDVTTSMDVLIEKVVELNDPFVSGGLATLRGDYYFLFDYFSNLIDYEKKELQLTEEELTTFMRVYQQWMLLRANAGPYANEINNLDFAKVKSYADKYGITLWSLHLPFANKNQLDASSLDEGIRKATLDEWCAYIEKGAEIGIKTFVLHPSCGAKAYDKLRPDRVKSAQKTLGELADFAHFKNVTIAVENLPRSALSNTIESLASIISVDNRLKVCFDTNHLLTQSNTDFIEFFSDKIHTIHVSDFDGKDEKHWLPGEGINDWQAIYRALLKIGYTGPWMYEVGLEPSPAWFIERPRTLCFEDFVDNANQIFEDKPFKLAD